MNRQAAAQHLGLAIVHAARQRQRIEDERRQRELDALRAALAEVLARRIVQLLWTSAATVSRQLELTVVEIL